MKHFALVIAVAACCSARHQLEHSSRHWTFNHPIERSLSPKDAGDNFTVRAQANQTFTVSVQQQGIDVVVTVLTPDGKPLVEEDNASEQDGTGGTETARAIALNAGD